MVQGRMARGLCGVALLVATSFAAPARAQNAPRAGEIVEARIVGPSDPMLGHFCIAPVGGAVGDTLLLARTANCSSGSHLARVRVSRGDYGGRFEHTALGLLIGAVTGGLIGRIAAGNGCADSGPCDDAGFAIGAITVVGVGTGALIGVVAGAVMPAGPRWVDVEGDRAIRVGSLDLRPAVRVSLGARRR